MELSKNLKALLSWEAKTALGIDPEQHCCQRGESLQQAWQIAFDLICEGEVYLEYTSSFCLLQLAAYNYASYLMDTDLPEEAMEIILTTERILNTFTEEVFPDHIQQLAREEIEHMMSPV